MAKHQPLSLTPTHPFKSEIYAPGNYFLDIEDSISVSVERIRSAYQFSQQLGLGKLYICFSGGKDSLCLLGLCKRAFSPEHFLDYVEFHYNVTGIDHPELFYFIRDNFPFVSFDLPHTSIWKLSEHYLFPPTRLMRFCCSQLKERGGQGRFVVTGVRWEESTGRKLKRSEFEADRLPFSSSESLEKFLNNDNSEDRREMEHCIPKEKYCVNPIIDWGEETVWRFIIQERLPYCSLYDCGFHRLGCIGCPMDSHRREVLDLYPAFKRQWLRTMGKIITIRYEKGLRCDWNTPEECYEWWVTG